MRRPGSPAQRMRRARSGADGFSIVELMLAIFVLAVMMSAVAAALGTAMRVSRGNTNRIVGANLASEQLDLIREDASQNFDTVIALLGQTTVTRSVKNVPYTITRDLTWVTGSANSSPCDGSASATNAYVRVTIEVAWSRLAGVKPVTSQTVIAPPVGVYDPNSGNAGVKVLSAAGLPQENIRVDLTGPGGAEPTQYTTTAGCAFFAFLAPGTYTATISAPNYADLQGVVTPSKSLGVNVAVTTNFGFTYDLLGALNATFLSVLNKTGPVLGGSVPNNTPLTLFNSGFQPTGIRVFPGTGATRNIPSLFPFTGGYVAWGGSCLDADPEQFAAGQRPPALSVPPGVTATGNVALPAIPVHVRAGGLLDLPNAHLTLVHGPDSGCTGGQTMTYDATVVTNTTGRVTVGAPYGTWKVQVDGRSPMTAWPTVTLSPLDTQPRAEINVDVL